MAHWHTWHSGVGHYYHRRPSRFLWFVIGAGTAAACIKHRENCRQQVAHSTWSHCVRAPIQVPKGLPDSPHQYHSPPPVVNEAHNLSRPYNPSNPASPPPWSHPRDLGREQQSELHRRPPTPVPEDQEHSEVGRAISLAGVSLTNFFRV
jgi:hypothetical protein